MSLKRNEIENKSNEIDTVICNWYKWKLRTLKGQYINHLWYRISDSKEDFITNGKHYYRNKLNYLQYKYVYSPLNATSKSIRIEKCSI